VFGGFTNVMVSIPPEDSANEHPLGRLFSRKHFGGLVRRRLASRVWEPQLPTALAAAKRRFTRSSRPYIPFRGLRPGRQEKNSLAPTSPKTVAGQCRLYPGRKLCVSHSFGKVGTRHRLYADAASVHPGGVAAMGDDMEKSESGPERTKHVTRTAWLSDFFTALEENSDWLAVHARATICNITHLLGRADLPTASYNGK